MKDFETLWQELTAKVELGDATSGTVEALRSGTHHLAKKVLKEAGEVMLAAESEGKDALALEISQLIYWLQVLMLDRGLTPSDIYRRL